jgi:hypothetical protein
MNDASNAQDQGLTTEQIAAARPAQAQEGIPAPANGPGYDHDNAAPLATDYAASGHDDRRAADAGDGSTATGPGSHASLLDDGELQNMTMRWKDIQAEFVDEPATAVREADALVAELMQRLAAMFANERAELETRWAGGNQVSTEELRQGLRLYRSFFERLLAA